MVNDIFSWLCIFTALMLIFPELIALVIFLVRESREIYRDHLRFKYGEDVDHED